MPTTRSEFLRAVEDAYHDPRRRDAVIASLKIGERITVAHALARYIPTLVTKRKRKGGENADGRNSHATNTRLVLAKLARTLDVSYLDEITPTTVQEYIDTAEASAKTIRNHVACLSGLGTWAVRMRYMGEHPTENADVPALGSHEIVYVKRADVPKVLAAVNGTSVELPVALAILAGLRRCEILRLVPSDVDWKEHVIRIRPVASKTGRPRTVPMSPTLERIIRERGSVGARLCLNRDGQPWNPEKLTRRTDYYLTRAGFGSIGYNELRHTYVTLSLQEGVDVWVVAGRAGHSVRVLEDRYGAHVERTGERVPDLAVSI